MSGWCGQRRGCCWHWARHFLIGCSTWPADCDWPATGSSASPGWGSQRCWPPAGRTDPPTWWWRGGWSEPVQRAPRRSRGQRSRCSGRWLAESPAELWERYFWDILKLFFFINYLLHFLNQPLVKPKQDCRCPINRLLSYMHAGMVYVRARVSTCRFLTIS